MASLNLDSTTLSVRFTRTEKFFGLIRDVDVPVRAIRSVTVETDAVRATRGLRAPGLGLPGVRKIGTWRGRGHRTLVCVRRDEPALRITLEGQRWTDLLIGTDDAQSLASRLQANLERA